MTTFVGAASVAALKTALTAIGDGSTTWAFGSTTNRPYVTRKKVHGHALPRLFTIVIYGSVKSWERIGQSGSTNYYDVKASVQVKAYIDEKATIELDAEQIEHDIAKAMRDHTLGGTVRDCRILDTTTDLPDPDGDHRCRVSMTVELQYQVSEDVPSVAVT